MQCANSYHIIPIIFLDFFARGNIIGDVVVLLINQNGDRTTSGMMNQKQKYNFKKNEENENRPQCDLMRDS
jgi:hypothetical protein